MCNSMKDFVAASGGGNCYGILSRSHFICGSLWHHPPPHKADGRWGEITITAEAICLGRNENQVLHVMELGPQERCQKWKGNCLHKGGENFTAGKEVNLKLRMATYRKTPWQVTSAREVTIRYPDKKQLPGMYNIWYTQFYYTFTTSVMSQLKVCEMG